ncbi:hypothetical protein GCM10017786_44470 [Amycolatopsis deserti]|uniref:Esterase-like activity of phytase family protein n=1 Tax=Amycolatopsis deserti TaxID=185696 RepID=A0ABQ3J964_9PSEU|nr:esterase-like activity of phytase family protein [Amycolatopsis deserti]GHF06020.1 hypothetical protein GCM10017786_44470 [Amycolatopsis deserti]
MSHGSFRRAAPLLFVLLSLGLAGPASAAQAPAPEPVCSVTDKRLGELSGLVSDGSRWYAINDGGTKVQIFVLGRDCAVQRVISGSTDPYDVEDLARAADGTFWLADTGDNRKQRDTVALLAVTPQGKVTLHRLTYPDGQHDAEALLLDASGTPYLVTKNPLGEAGIYRPAQKLTSPGPTPLERVGSISIKSTDTPGGPVAGFGSVLVTGGAVSADGKVVALRTYTDAYLFAAPDRDVAAALRREPVRVPLPDEQQGEAIAFDPDGTLVSASEGTGPIRVVRGATALVADTASADEGGQSSGSGGEAAGGTSGQGVDTVPGLLIAVVVAGGVVFAWTKLRKRR